MRAALLALLLGLLSSYAARADCPPQPQAPTAAESAVLAPAAPDRGFLWRLRRDGRSSYLYGSLHIGRAAWLFPGPALRQAWAETELLALELDLSDAQTLRTLSQAGRAGAPLSPALQRRLDAQARAVCLPPRTLAALHPILQLSTLALFDARRDGFDAGFGQEMVLTALAKQQGRPIVALERAEEQLRALIPADPAEARQLIEQSLTQLERADARGPMLKLALAWASGDLARLQSYEQWCDCVATAADRRWLRRLNDERNPQLAARIAALHAAGKPLLAAVGALHMSGPQALPRLLEGLGFEVERVGMDAGTAAPAR